MVKLSQNGRSSAKKAEDFEKQCRCKKKNKKA